MSEKKHVMIDLETMGNSPNAAIVAIGAVGFDFATNRIGEKFYRTVSLSSSVERGGKMDADTVLWWMQQSDEARGYLNKEAVHIDQAMHEFTSWMQNLGDENELCVWGNGADFDNVILASAYRSYGDRLPWKFYNNRCYRTLKSLRPDIPMQRVGTYHHALDDAESQALHLMTLMKAIRGEQ